MDVVKSDRRDSLAGTPGSAETADRLLSQEVLPEVELEDGDVEQPRCPYCTSLDITFETINQKVGFASILVAVPIPIPKNRWKCHACGREWKDSSQQISSDLV
jgi:transposase-like protein